MAVDVTTEIEIDRPRAEVAAFASDPDRTKQWYQNITSVSWQTPRPAVEGSRVTFEARFLGRRLRYTYEIRELVPEERLVMSTSEGAFPMETTYTWADTPVGGTLMTLRNRGEPSGFASIAAPAMAAAMRRANSKDLRTLKAIFRATEELTPEHAIRRPTEAHSTRLRQPRRAATSEGAARRRDRVPLGAKYSGGGGLQNAAR